MGSKKKEIQDTWGGQSRILEYSKRRNNDHEEFITLLALVPSGKNVPAVEITTK
jgi:hypothetical protein